MNDDLNYERRLLLAFALATIVFFLLPLFEKKQLAHKPAAPVTAPASQSAPATTGTPAPVSAGTAQEGNVPAAATTAATTTTAPPTAEMNAQPRRPLAATAEQTTTIDTDAFHIVFSNRGGVVRSWVLKKWTDEQNHPLDLVDTAFSLQHGFPLSLWVTDESLRNTINNALFQSSGPSSKAGQAGVSTIEFRWSDGTLAVTKQFSFDQGYVIQMRTTVTQNGTPLAHAIAWPGEFGDRTIIGHYGQERFFTAHPQQNIDTVAAKKVNNDQTMQGEYSLTGVEDLYFALGFMPPAGTAQTITTFKTSFLPQTKNAAGKPITTKNVDTLGLAVGQGGFNDIRLFVGPKKIDLLKGISPQLRQLVDFGWFSIFAEPLFLWMNWTYDHWIHNYGWVIVALTFLMTMAMMPLRIKAQKAQMKMAALQPRLKPLNDKMRKYPLRDPRRVEIQQQIMKLHQEEGINPLGGCLPILPQFVLLFAFYRVLGGAIELRHAPWFGYLHDLSAADPYYILPIILIITQFWSMTLMPTQGMGGDQMQAKMMKYVMPVVFGYIFFYLPSGVNLYYLSSNIISVGQQWYLNKRYKPQPPAPVEQRARAGAR